MALQKYVTSARMDGGVRTVTLSDVTRLFPGWTITVEGVGVNYDGTHELAEIDETAGTVSYAGGDGDDAEHTVAGLLAVPVQWISEEDVTAALGQEPAEELDALYLQAVIDSAQEWAFEERRKARYVDFPHLCPNASGKAGTVQKAVVEYRERGSVDGLVQFDAIGTSAMVGSAGALYDILRKLGCRRPAVF